MLVPVIQVILQWVSRSLLVDVEKASWKTKAETWSVASLSQGHGCWGQTLADRHPALCLAANTLTGYSYTFPALKLRLLLNYQKYWNAKHESHAWAGPGASPASCLCSSRCCKGTQRGKLAAAKSESSHHSYNCWNCQARSWTVVFQQPELGSVLAARETEAQMEGRETAIPWLACTSFTGGKERPPHKNDCAALVSFEVLHQPLRAPVGTNRLQLRPMGKSQAPPMHGSGKGEQDSWGMQNFTLQTELPETTAETVPETTCKAPCLLFLGWCWVQLAWVRGRPAPLLLCMAGKEMSYFIFWFVSHFSNTNH